MKKNFMGIFSFVLGSIPIGLGYYVHNRYLHDEIAQMGLTMISVMFFLAWFFWGMFMGGFKVNIKISVLLTHFVGIICYLSSVIQEDIIGKYIEGPIGFIPQLYFLPMLKVSYNIDLFNQIHRLPTTFLITLFLMMILFITGWQFRVRVFSGKVVKE